MWIECDDYRRPLRRAGVFSGSGDHRLMTAMDAVEDADGQKQWTGQPQEFGD
jgi:hypothetical protein